MADEQTLEQIADSLVQEYEIHGPPIPIESMLQRPPRRITNDPAKLEISQLSGGFIDISGRYTPRMSLARMLVRRMIASKWGQEQSLSELLRNDEAGVHQLARMIMMPASLLRSLSEPALTPEYISVHFEVPPDDALLRLNELGLLKKQK